MTARVLEIVNLFLQKSLGEEMDDDQRDDLIETLVAQGHHPDDVNAALSIVDNIHQRLQSPTLSGKLPPTNRLFLLLETFHLSPEVRGYLTHLVQMGVINPIQREEIVERCMMMDPAEISVDHVEVVVEDLLSEKPKFLGHFDETASDYYH